MSSKLHRFIKPRPVTSAKVPQKPAFTQKPFASAPPSVASGWSSSSFLSTMRHPSSMTGDELGYACVAAAREKVDSEKFWDLIAKRAAELGSMAEPREISLVLNGMSRTRCLSNHKEMITALDPVIRKKLPYFSSTQMAMTVSGLAKSFSIASLPADLVPALLTEIKARVHEFSTSVELCMVLNALAKLGVVDRGLSQRISAIVQSKIRASAINFHARELCVIASALSQIGVRELALYELIESRVLPSISELTPLEVSRLMVAFARAGKSIDELLETTLRTSADRFRFLSSADLTSAVFGFGSVCEYMEPNSLLIELLDSLKLACIHSFAVFQPKEIASVLLSLSRWRILMTESELEQTINRLRLMSKRIEGMDLIVIVGSMPLISSKTGRSQILTDYIIQNSSNVLEALAKVRNISQADWQSVARGVEALVSIGKSLEVVPALSVCLINNSGTLDHVARNALFNAIGDLLPQDSDLLLVIRPNS